MSTPALITTEKTTQAKINWPAAFTTIGFTTIGGAIVGGIPGSLVGLCASIADEILIHNTTQEKHVISSTAFWSQVVIYPFVKGCASLLPATTLPVYQVASLAMSSAATYLTDDFFCFKQKLGLPLDSFLTLNRFFDEKQILSKKEAQKIYNTFYESPKKGLNLIYSDAKELYQNEFFIGALKLIGLGIVNVTLDLYLIMCLKNHSENLFITTWYGEHQDFLESLNVQSPLSWSELSGVLTKCSGILYEGSKIISLLFARSVLSFSSFVIDSHIRAQMGDRILKNSMNMVMKSDYGRKVLSESDGKEVLYSMLINLNVLFNEGAMKLDSAFTGAYEALLAYSKVLNLSPQAFFPYFCSIVPLQRGLKKLGIVSKTISRDHLENQEKLGTWINAITINLDQIKLRDADEFVKHKFGTHQSIYKELEQKSELLKKINQELQGIYKYLYALTDMVYLAFNVLTSQIKLSEVTLFKKSMSSVSNFLSTNLDFVIQTSTVSAAKEKIDRFFEIIDSKEDKALKKLFSPQPKITFKDYTLYLDGEKLLTIENFDFEMGKRYAISGKSGCGKSSTLIDLKQGLCGSLKSKGEIFIYSKEDEKPNLMFLDQDLFLPYDCTLLECIYFPNLLEKLSDEDRVQFEQRVLSLFSELEIDSFIENEDQEGGLASRLDSEKFKLSGGQRKKIGVIQAILAQPDVLIMDEIFTGLDPNSLVKCQKAIETYLPNTLILAVDHHAEDNNYNGFYSSEVNFADGQVVEKELSSKEVALEIKSE